jgi:hypothetical protein
LKFAHFLCKPGMNPHQRYEQLWRDLQACDELDFDYGFCVEHHFRPDESWVSSPSLYVVGAAAPTQELIRPSARCSRADRCELPAVDLPCPKIGPLHGRILLQC